MKSENRDCVILLHGLARTGHSLNRMEKALQRNGYRTVNCHYPSRRYPVEHLAASYIPRAITACRENHQPGRIHFVTHSMGGILLRYYLSQERPPELGRTVMLAPPNGGSELVDRLGGFWWFRLLYGKAGTQLGTTADSLPNRLGPADFEVGIIAGNRVISPLAALLFPGENDGKVSIRSTRLEGMADFIVLPHSHTFMMSSREVIDQTLGFLRCGHFNHREKR